MMSFGLERNNMLNGREISDKIKEIKLSKLETSDFSRNENVKTQLPSDIKLVFFAELFGNIGRFNSAGTK